MGFMLIAIDINGKKGPNKWGHDLYTFELASNGNYFRYKTGSCMLPQDGGVMTNIKMKELFGHE